jgi:hypothetical protein
MILVLMTSTGEVTAAAMKPAMMLDLRYEFILLMAKIQ